MKQTKWRARQPIQTLQQCKTLDKHSHSKMDNLSRTPILYFVTYFSKLCTFHFTAVFFRAYFRGVMFFINFSVRYMYLRKLQDIADMSTSLSKLSVNWYVSALLG